MNHKSILLVGGGLFLTAALCAPASAQVKPGMDLTMEVYSHEYEEEFGGTWFMTNEGFLGSIGLGYTAPLDDGFFIRVAPSIALGSVDYTSNGTGSIDGTTNYTFTADLLAGKEFTLQSGTIIAASAGLGYRAHWDDKGGEVTTTGYLGYDRRSEYLYMPLSLSVNFPAGDNWRIEPAITYKVFLQGTQTSKFSGVDSTCTDLENDQESGYGIAASLMGHTHWGETPVAFGPFYRQWNIDESEVGYFSCGATLYFGIEPENTTIEFGMGIRANF